MIRVNLLAARQRGLTSSSSQSAALSLSDNQRANELVKRLALLAVIPVALFFVEREIIPTKIEEREVSKKRASELKSFNLRSSDTSKKIETRKKDAEKFEAQLNALKKLKHSQFYELRVIDLIQDIIPERVWVSELRFMKPPEGSNADNKLDLTISTTSENEAENFFSAINMQRDYVIEALYTDRRPRSDNAKVKDISLAIVLKKELPSLKNQWNLPPGSEGEPKPTSSTPQATEVKQ